MIKQKKRGLIAKLLTCLIAFLLTCLIVNPIAPFFQTPCVFAESKDTIDENQEVTYVDTAHGHIEISAVVKTQSPVNKSIPVEVTYTSKISGIKGYLTVSDYSGLTPKNDKIWVPIEKDKTYKKTIQLQPKREGSYDVTVDIIIFGYDVNYGDSTTITVTLNKNLVVRETASTFLLYQILMYLAIVFVIVLVVIGIRKYGKKVFSTIRNWVLNDPRYKDVTNREEIESFYKKLHEKGDSSQDTEQTKSE
ncbi:hypothetical protein JW962_03110 [Candidatus Dojkabacteria bacterium]|nr:hypothetical protein [Candidatus Dojkabacteria bacterium]